MQFDRKKVRKLLKKKSRQYCVVFAYRCGLRVLPFLANAGNFNYWVADDRKAHLLSVIRVFDVVESVIRGDIDAVSDVAAARAAARAAVAYASAAARAATTYATAAYTTATDANAAAYSAAAAADVDADCAAVNASAAYAVNAAADDFEVQLFIDLAIETDVALFTQPLWKLPPDGWARATDRFQQALTKIGFCYWFDAFQLRVTGQTLAKGLSARTHLPKELLAQGPDAVTRYLQALETQAAKVLKEVKVVFIGDGGAGKTSLVRKIFDRNAPLSEEEEPTPGVDIHHWEPPEADVHAHLWDFGGQVIMHATHQFFMTQRSLYVIVLDGRKEQDPEYWLNHTTTFGGDSAVLVVINKVDHHDGELERRTLQKKYPHIHGFYAISCKDNRGLDAFVEDLTQTLTTTPGFEVTLPQTWFEIKEQLNKINADYIAIDEYERLCAKQNTPDVLEQQTLLGYLHNLGIVIFFEDLQYLNTQVLNPRWLTHAVYTIINSELLKTGKGELHIKQLADILSVTKSEYKYPPEKYPYIMEVMQKFELCYAFDQAIQAGGPRYLIPDLLEKDQPEDLNFPKENALAFRFTFSFLPRAVIARFIVLLAHDIKDQCRWRYGVVLDNPTTKSQAMVVADHDLRMINVWVKGEQARDYFAVIRNTFHKIFDTYSQYFERQELIPVAPDIFVPYEELLGLERMGERHYVSGRLDKRFDLKQLLDGVESSESRQQQQPNIYVDARTSLKLQNTVQINIEIKNEVLQLQRDLTLLSEDIQDQVADPAEQALLAKDMQRVEKAVAELEQAQDKDIVKNSVALERLKEFVEKCEQVNTRVGKAIQAVENGRKKAKKFADNYNKIAQWCGLPNIPPIFGE